MKLLNGWSKKKTKRLRKFYDLQLKYGNVMVKDLAGSMKETASATHIWKDDCLKQGIIKEDTVSFRYLITELGKEILEAENE